MKRYKLLSASSLVLVIVAAVACGGEQQDEPSERTPVPTPTGTPSPEVVHLVEDFLFGKVVASVSPFRKTTGEGPASRSDS